MRRPHSRKRFLNIQSILLLFLLLFGVASPLYAMDITLRWAPNDEPNVAGYKVFYREEGQSYNYDVPYWESTEPECTVYDLDETKTYYFVVRAFDNEGHTSDDSNEVALKASTSINSNDNGAGNSGAGSSGVGNSGAGNSGAGSSGVGNSGAGNSGAGDSGTGSSGAGNSGAINDDAGGRVTSTVKSGGGGGCFIATAAYESL
jgi:hypothetical protein